jgi:hypothetical protein
MSNAREFHIGDVLSITAGPLVSPRHMEGVYDILGFMTGETLFTHQLPRAGDECAPELLRQHPQLADVDASAVTTSNWSLWLEEQIKRFGETLSVTPLAKREPQYDTPVADAIEMMGDPTKVIVIEP